MATSLGHPEARIHTPAPGTRDASAPARFFLVIGIGLIAGTLDIGDCIAFEAPHRVTPAMIFRYIASGLIGARASHPGQAPVVLGVLLHYLIALTWTTAFYLASRKLAVLTRRPVVSGLLYGAFVFLCMNVIVLPLAGLPPAWTGATPADLINGVLAVMLCIGLTISLLVRRLGNSRLRAGL
jgi:hypothetical protein